MILFNDRFSHRVFHMCSELGASLTGLRCCFQQKEMQIRRQFHDAVKTQQKQYKAFKEHTISHTPKAQQKAAVKKLREEQTRKIAMLGQQYESSIEEMMQQQTVRSTLVSGTISLQ